MAKKQAISKVWRKMQRSPFLTWELATHVATCLEMPPPCLVLVLMLAQNFTVQVGDAGNGTANDACCYCGGGVENPVDPPISAPSMNTAPPVPAPSAISSSPATYEEQCEDISTRGECNQTFGCSWAKRRGTPRACYEARTTQECDFDTKRKCKRKGCRWNNSQNACKRRWE